MSREDPPVAEEPLVPAPIFLNCISRGGSNIFWNLFLTHPDVCSPIRETLEIFRADWRAPTLEGIWLAITSGQPRLFDQWNLKARRPLRESRRRYVDRVLHRYKMQTVEDPEMRFKTATEVYTEDEVATARLVAKNNNGLIFANDVLREIYPDATFFCLVRDPVPLWESHKRRRMWRTPEQFSSFYLRIVNEMLAQVDGHESCHLIRFEDVLSTPLRILREVYDAAGLNLDSVSQVRLRAKEHFRADGSRGTDWKKGRHRWLEFDEVESFLDPKINQLHESRLEERERAEVRQRTAPIRKRLGYVDSTRGCLPTGPDGRCGERSD